MYEIYFGSQKGATDLVMAQETRATSIVLTSGKLTSPATLFCFITAVAPSGQHESYSQTLYL